MSPRVSIIAALAMLAACQPDGPAEREVCGWRCGPMSECPNGYACYPDGRCHVSGSSQTRGCTLDGGLAEMPPSIALAEPGDNDTEVPTDVVVRIVFDKPVRGVDVSTFTLRRESVFDPIPATVTYDEHDRTATLRPVAQLDVGAVYVITVAPTIVDENGRPYQGRSWEFVTVRDATLPTVRSLVPPTGATNVGIEDPVLVTFSEGVWVVSETAFTVRDPNGVAAGTIRYVSSQLARATGPWKPNTRYTVTLTSDVIDFAGNPLAGAPLVSSFTTGPDTVPPRITLREPENGESEVPAGSSVIVQFSEPVIGYATAMYIDQDGAKVPATVTYDTVNKRVRLVPSPPLKIDTAYRVVIEPGLTDTSGNPVVPGVISWTFRTSPEL